MVLNGEKISLTQKEEESGRVEEDGNNEIAENQGLVDFSL